MGKRKPKLYRMKQFDVSPKNKFFFLLKMNQFIFSPSHSTFYFTENLFCQRSKFAAILL